MKKPKVANRLSGLILIMIVFAAIVWLMIATLCSVGKQTSYYENRALAKLQPPDAEAVLNGSFFTDLENFLSDHSAFREDLLGKNTDLDLNVLKRPVVNDVVIGDDLYMRFNEFDYDEENLTEKGIREFTHNISTVKSACDEVGAPFYYVGFPEQHTFYADEYPWYLNNLSDFEDREVDILNEILPPYGIGFIDLREALTGKDTREAYSSRVDNHMSMRGAFEAYRLILGRINNDWNAKFPILDETDVDFYKLENPYIGSMERKLVGKVNVDESLYYLELHKDIPYTRHDMQYEVVPFTFDFPENNKKKMSYTFYMGGDVGKCIIDTHRKKLPSVLIYGDSFTNSIECVLYASCNKMYSLDLRNYDGTVSDFILENEPDYVICARSFSTLLQSYDNGGI